MDGVDKFYILTNGEYNDQPLHKWLRADTQQEILKRRAAEANSKRAGCLRHLDITDTSRSFSAGNHKKAKTHNTYFALARIRVHTAPHDGETTRIDSKRMDEPVPRLHESHVSRPTLPLLQKAKH